MRSSPPPLLNGFRGEPPADQKGPGQTAADRSEIIEAYPEIQEMDLNPVRVYERGLTVVDARILLNPVDCLSELEGVAPNRPGGT